MRIEFCGADRTVTGSCHLLMINGKRILLDCGLYQGSRETARQLNQAIVPGALRADAVLLSHGHLDHCGKLPVLVKAGFRGPIYTTSASVDVARIVLLDSAEIQEEDAAYLNRRQRGQDQKPVEPLYTRADTHDVLKLFNRVNYGQRIDLGGVGATMFDAGHILGSAYIVLDWKQDGVDRTLLFTADIGRYGTPILRDPAAPPTRVDYLITESTYGGRRHASIEEIEPQLLEIIQGIIARRSRAIFPAFAVGRTQTILWYLAKFIREKRIAPIPVYVDSPMGVEVTRVHTEHRAYYDEQTQAMIGRDDLFGERNVRLASSSQQSREINADRGPCVIIASSPTCEFGRVLHHLKQSIENPADVIVFTGWIPPSTLGRRLQDGQERVRIFDRFYDLKCQVRTIHGLSAHADGDELMKFLTPALKPETVAHVVHGEPEQAEAMADRLVHAGIRTATVPAMATSAFA